MKNKRFIAGAVCPRCAEMDKIVTFEREGKSYRACVACDFEEEQPELATGEELPTRVNQVADKDDSIQVVKIQAVTKH